MKPINHVEFARAMAAPTVKPALYEERRRVRGVVSITDIWWRQVYYSDASSYQETCDGSS